MPLPDQILDRLEDQISWYERKSDLNRRAFRWIKATEIVAAAIIPLLAVSNLSHGSVRHVLTAILTCLVAMLYTGRVPNCPVSGESVYPRLPWSYAARACGDS